MLRVKKISDAIFPRDFSETLKSYNNYDREKTSHRYEQKFFIIKNHYQNQLNNLKKQVKKITYTKRVNELQDIFNTDPYLYANKNNINYQLTYDEIQNIKKQVSTKIFKSKEDKTEIKNKIKQAELNKITTAFNKQFENLNRKYPPKIDILYEDTEESIIFQNKYQENLEDYAKDFNLPLIPYKESYCSNYAFLVDHAGGRGFAITVNKSIVFNEYQNITLCDIKETEISTSETQAIMYLPKFNNLAFFLYKNCLYRAEYNEFFTDEELLLRVKEKIYKEDKKFEQLKKQIELYENSDLSVNSKKKTREPIPEDVKFEVWRRDQGRCVICGSQENLEFDHIIPFSKGGSSTARNIQLLCQNCNRHKSDKI